MYLSVAISLFLLILGAPFSVTQAQDARLQAEETGVSGSQPGARDGIPTIAGVGESKLRILDLLAGKAPRLADFDTSDRRMAFSAEGVGNAASYETGAVSPGEIIVVFGTDIGPAQLEQLQVEGEKVVTQLAGTRVLFDGIPGALIYVSSGQISVVVPYSVWNQETTSIQVEVNGVLSDPVEIPVVEAVPGLFTLDGSGQGQAAIINQDGTVNSPENPAPQGSIVALYATGEGQTDPGGIDGQVAISSFPAPLLPVNGYIGGDRSVKHWAAAAPWMVAGVMQVNLTVPDINGGPNVSVQIEVGDAWSPLGVSMAVVQLSGGALAPGMTIDTAGTTSAQDPDLGGRSVRGVYKDFEIQDSKGNPILGATLLTTGVMSTNTGHFISRTALIDTSDFGSGAGVRRLDIAGFAGHEVKDANFRLDSVGDQGPVTASRSEDGDVVSFFFDPPLNPPSESRSMVVFTGADSYESTGQMTIYAQLPGDETLYSTIVTDTRKPK